jgi:NAD(P)-dependent dehydrogenase (short-subunit alcohol dehydrogenase family)
MKILIVGGTGTIGKAVAQTLQADHELIRAGRTRGDLQVDIESVDSIEKMYQTAGAVDAVVSTAGTVVFEALENFTSEQYYVGLNNKLMGQVNLVLCGIKHLSDNGSFTLTSGILNEQPVQSSSSAAMANGAIDAFVRAAAIELPRGLRINSVSPTLITESIPLFGDAFKGFEPSPAAKVAMAYQKSIEHKFTGKVFQVGHSDIK